MHAGDFQDLSPVVFGFDAERFFADGLNKRIVVFGDDDNSRSVTVCRFRSSSG